MVILNAKQIRIRNKYLSIVKHNIKSTVSKFIWHQNDIHDLSSDKFIINIIVIRLIYLDSFNEIRGKNNRMIMLQILININDNNNNNNNN